MKTKNFALIFVGVFALLVASCLNAGSQGSAPTRYVRAIRVACVGNSITFGDGIKDRDKWSYPAQLQRMLGNAWTVKNFGSSGRTILKKGDAPYWKEKEFAAAKAFMPDVVLIKLGTNDSKPQNWKYKKEFIPDYENMVEEFENLPTHPKVYVCFPVPAYPGNWGISDSIIHYEELPMLKKVAAERKAQTIDLYSALSDRRTLFPDRVHPNEEGAQMMAQVIYDTLTADFHVARAPAPFGPIPTPRQQAWEDLEYAGFLHFGINTFTDKEWGQGDEDPALFNPTNFDANQIASVAKAAGMKELILVAKHHDGFCLWPSKYTDHSVKKSPWKNGTGDVVKEISDACAAQGLKFGIYLSPWDRNSKDYGKPEYIEYYRNQLNELLANYGNIDEIFFDGANGGDGYYGGARETRTIDRKTYYDWSETWDIVRKTQPTAVMFSDIGPDIRWVGNESGFAGDTCWATYSPIGEDGGVAAPGYAQTWQGVNGEEDGQQWMPAQCDVSIRPGWFYHQTEDGSVKSPEELFDLYFKSVGHNASLLLNVPPDKTGKLNENDVNAILGFKKLLDQTFTRDYALGGTVVASNVRGNSPQFSGANAVDGNNDTYWAPDDKFTSASLVIDLKEPATVNCAMLQEFVPLGQRVEKFAIGVLVDGKWKKVAEGSTIGHKRLVRFSDVTTSRVALNILKSRACPTISTFALYEAPQVNAPAPHQAPVIANSTGSSMAFAGGKFDSLGEVYGPSFSPDMKTVYFTKRNSRKGDESIYYAEFDGAVWSSAKLAPFSGLFYDKEPFVSPDGTKVFFASTRPQKPGSSESAFDLFVVTKDSTGWGVPRNMGAAVNSDAYDNFPSVAANGNLYFASKRDGGKGGLDLYVAKFSGTEYQAAENLGDAINTSAMESDPYIAPDESYLIFTSTRDGGKGAGDLYITFHSDGKWTDPQNLGGAVNTPEFEYAPLVSPDGKTFYFSRDWGGIFQIPVAQLPIDSLRAVAVVK
jgi:alpha-L-fucosidase